MNRTAIVVFLILCSATVVIFNVNYLKNVVERLDSKKLDAYGSAQAVIITDNHISSMEMRNTVSKDDLKISHHQHHQIAGLSCERYGGPSDEIAAEMVYWRDIPKDAKYKSPFANYGPNPKYLTFEPDEGGWNNIRMSMGASLGPTTKNVLVGSSI